MTTATSEMDPLDKCFQAAADRWPAVPFPREAYRRHAGNPPPPHAVDLYLAGAAGHRIGAAWAAIETDFGPPTCRILQFQPRADIQAEDLWAEARVRLMAEDRKSPSLPDGRLPARIIRYRGLVALLNYFVVVSKRVAIERDRRRREATGILGPTESAPEFQVQARQDTPDQHATRREIEGTLHKALAAAYGALSSEQQFLISAVYRDGMLQKKAGALLGWSEFKASRELAKAIETLRKSLKDVADADWDRELLSAWSGCWADCWKNSSEGRSTQRDLRRVP